MHVLWRGDTLQRLRLVSGLILFTFAATHFINHALGLVSIDMMQVVQQWRWTVTRSWPGTIVLLAALLTHASLGLYKLAGRATLRLPRWELVQILLGISIPFLLLPHIVNTRIAHVYFNVNDIYVYELARLWPASAIIQSLLLVIVWVHGCMGIHFWLRLYPPYRRVFPILLTLAVIIPLAALGGFAVSGSTVAAAIEIPSVFANLKVLTRWPDALAGETLGWLRNLARIEFGAVLVVVSGCLAWTYFARLAGPKVTVAYTAGPTVKVPQGPTLLEISRMKGVPHASVCGGRARCSTCRVRIERGSFALPSPVFPESVTLGSIGAPPNVRLACQIRPEHYLVVTRLLKSDSTGPEGERDRRGRFRRRREDTGRDVRRPARFHAPVGEAAAVRHRLRAQRVLRRRRRSHHRARRLDRQVPRRRAARRVRPARRRRCRLPAGVAHGPRHRPRARSHQSATRGRARTPARRRHRHRCRPAAARPHRLR